MIDAQEIYKGYITNQLQYLLKYMGFDVYSTKPDGKIGPATSSAIILFQWYAKIATTGVADSKTLEKVKEYTERGIMRDDIISSLKKRGAPAADAEWYYTNKGIKLASSLQVNNQSQKNGKIQTQMTQVYTNMGNKDKPYVDYGYLQPETAWGWAMMYQEVIDENKKRYNAGEKKLDVSQFIISGPRSAYRTLETQDVIKKEFVAAGKGEYAASPGSSNYGLGLAFDLVLGSDKKTESWAVNSSDESKWLMDHEKELGLERHYYYEKKDGKWIPQADSIDGAQFYEEWHVNYTATPR